MLIGINQNFFTLGKNLFNSFFGNFLVLSICWSFSFFILNEIRHLFWDLGYGFDVRIARITGVAVFIGSFILAILFYKLGGSLL